MTDCDIFVLLLVILIPFAKLIIYLLFKDCKSDKELKEKGYLE